MSKSRTKWLHVDYGHKKETWIKIGLLSNPETQGYKYDCVRMQVKTAWGKQDDLDFCVRLDEASSISAGFIKVLDYVLQNGAKELHQYVKGHKGGKL